MADRNLQTMQNSASERVPLLCETEDFKRGPPASKIPSKPSGAGYDANERCEALGNLRSLKRLIVAWEPEVILRHYTRCTMCSYVSEAHMTAKDFREYAEEHLGWAKTARSTKERQTFLQMAQAWLEAADMWEAVYGVEPTSNAQSSAVSR
jgi:hypothetical protein